MPTMVLRKTVERLLQQILESRDDAALALDHNAEAVGRTLWDSEEASVAVL